MLARRHTGRGYQHSTSLASALRVQVYSYPITIEKEGKRYYAYSEDFPGVYGLGKTMEEAKRSILKAMRLYIHHCGTTPYESRYFLGE